MKLFFGIICLLFGCFTFYYTFKNPNKGDDGNSPDYKGYASGIGLIACGIILIKTWFEMN